MKGQLIFLKFLTKVKIYLSSFYFLMVRSYQYLIKLSLNPEETIIEKQIENDTCTPVFIVALFTIGRIGKQPRYPSTENG